jgi:hypothetical protein
MIEHHDISTTVLLFLHTLLHRNDSLPSFYRIGDSCLCKDRVSSQRPTVQCKRQCDFIIHDNIYLGLTMSGQLMHEIAVHLYWVPTLY